MPNTKNPRPGNSKKQRRQRANPAIRNVVRPAAVVPALRGIRPGRTWATQYYSALVNPADSRPVRLPTGLDREPSAVLALTTTTTLASSSTASANYPSLPAGSTFVAVFKQPTRAFVKPVLQSPAYSLACVCVQGPMRATGAGTLVTDYPGERVAVGQQFVTYSSTVANALVIVGKSLNFAYAYAATGTSPHNGGGYLYPGVADGKRFIWMDAGDILGLTLTIDAYAGTGATLQDVKYIIERVGGFEAPIEEVTELVSTSGTNNWVVVKGDYYAVTLVQYTTTSAYLGHSVLLKAVITHNAGDTTYAHYTMPEVESSAQPFLSCRTTACSALMTNVDATIKREGTVYAGRMGPGNTFSTATIADVQSINKEVRYSGKAELGAYGWLPLDEYGRTYHSYRVMGSAKDGYPDLGGAFNLRSQRDWLYYWFVDTDPSTQTNFMLRFDYHIEFKSTSQLFLRDVTSARAADAEDAVMLASRLHPVMENPLHLADIKGLLNSGKQFAHRNKHTIATALSLLFPQYAGVFRAIESQL